MIRCPDNAENLHRSWLPARARQCTPFPVSGLCFVSSHHHGDVRSNRAGLPLCWRCLSVTPVRGSHIFGFRERRTNVVVQIRSGAHRCRVFRTATACAIVRSKGVHLMHWAAHIRNTPPAISHRSFSSAMNRKPERRQTVSTKMSRFRTRPAGFGWKFALDGKTNSISEKPWAKILRENTSASTLERASCFGRVS